MTSLVRNRSSASSLIIPESDRRVSLTGFTNLGLDDAGNGLQNEDDAKRPVRVRFAEVPAVGLELSGFGIEKPVKRKYSVALQTLKPFRPSSKDGKLPINNVGFFSYIFMTWFSPLVWKMFRNRAQPVAEGDIWECSDAEGVRVNTQRLSCLWNEELKENGERKANFLSVWWRFIRTRTAVLLVMLVINALATFVSSAFLVNLIVKYLESADDNIGYGLGLVAAMLACEVTRAVTFSTLMNFGAQTGARFRSGFMGIMYDKLLKLRTIKGKTNSEIINVFSVDSYRVYLATWTVVWLLSVPAYLVIGTVYCYILIGYWCFVAIGTFVICYLGQTTLSSLIAKVRRLCTQYTDLRVRRMGEVLNSMKFIKMYAWEKPFTDAIKDVRQSGQKYQLYSALVNAITGSIIPVTPTIASVVAITVYTAAGNELTASTAFAVIGTMNFLRVIVALIPFSLKTYAEAKVSFNRIQGLLLMEEYQPPSSEVFDKANVVEIKAGNFVWDTAPEPTNEPEKQKTPKRKSSVASLSDSRRESFSMFALTDINVDIKKGQLVGICGAVGSGKSSLMSAVMGRLLIQRGHLAADGDIAYVAQQAWIFNATLKENIIFGRDYDEKRYQGVIRCCGLEPDICLLTDGDETEIGERGANLSGGQKQRVNLARAVYSDSDIFILDDPLSALDVKVGQQIFHDCIKGMLGGKTVLLVTHQLQYLKHCDDLYVMDEGHIVERGDHVELLANDGMYSEMFRIFEQTSMKPVKHANGEADGEPSSLTKCLTETPTSQPQKNSLSKAANESSKKKGKGRLVLTEEAAIGDISFGTYNAYIRAAGGWIVAIAVVFSYFVASGTIIFSDWWLSQWITSLQATSSKTWKEDSAWTSTFNQSSSNATSLLFNSTTTVLNRSEPATALVAGISSWQFTMSNDVFFIVYIVSLPIMVVFQILKSFAGAKASIVASNNIHAECLNKVMKAPMSFFDANPVGRILNRFSKDIDEGDVFLPQVSDAFLRIFTLVILSVAMAAYIVPWILIALVLAWIPGDEFGDVASLTIFLFDVSMRWIGLRLDLMASMTTVSVGLIFVITKGMISPASAGLVLGLCGKTVALVQFLVRLMNEAEARFTSIERLHEYNTNLTSEPQHATKMASEEWPDKGAVQFSNVVMRYRPEMDPVLRKVNFDIQPKEKVGIVGRTGAGKSSLAAALFRLVELSDGNIYVDGEDISKLHLSAIRSKISTITQEPVLFAGTVRYNIDPFSSYKNLNIWEALEKVHMKEKIQQFDEGLEVMVEENGENFSVGERQLMCLARAVLRSSKILLLDEATANIDTSTDAMIQQTIRECFSECTVITIAHRLNTVLHSDKIIILDSGQVMECASPQDLLSNPNSFFNAMISAQNVKTPS